MLTPGVLRWKNQPEIFQTGSDVGVGCNLFCFCILFFLWHESLGDFDHISSKRLGHLLSNLWSDVTWRHVTSLIISHPEIYHQIHVPPLWFSEQFRIPLVLSNISGTGMGRPFSACRKPPARHQVVLPHVASQRGGFAAATRMFVSMG